jgi:hypothetical protein
MHVSTDSTHRLYQQYTNKDRFSITSIESMYDL